MRCLAQPAVAQPAVSPLLVLQPSNSSHVAGEVVIQQLQPTAGR